MKRRYLSFLTGIASAVAALAFLTVTVLCIVRINVVAKTIQDTTDELGGIQLLAYAGLGYVLAILGIIISAGLACYRATLCYYYIKLFTCDDEFYSERKGGIIGFSVLTAIMLAVLSVAAVENTGIIPESIHPAIVFFVVIYVILFVLPLSDMIIFIIKKSRRQKVEEERDPLPTKEEISDELERLATDVTEEKERERENISEDDA